MLLLLLLLLLRTTTTYNGQIVIRKAHLSLLLLKEGKISFRCCPSQNHIAQDCTVKVMCTTRDYSRHATAMQLACLPEKTRKFILVDVFPTANPRKQRGMHVVVNDQSNRSFIILDQLAFSGECEPYTPSSCPVFQRTMDNT